MIENLLEERGERYGRFVDNARVAQAIRRVILHDSQPDVVREALTQIAGKLSRIACGDPYYPDNWKDIAGYATLVVDWLQNND